jgi:hypothetical protein
LLVLGIVVLGLALPATSAAGVNPCSQSDVQATCQINTTPIHKGSKGFELTLSITQQVQEGYGGPVKVNSLAGVLFRHRGQATESDYYSPFGSRRHPLEFSWGGTRTRPLQFVKIKGTFADGRGSINLTFHATAPARHVTVPKGCWGHGGRRRPGILSGSYTLRADKLGTITQKSFKATITTAAYTCNPAHAYGVQTDASHHLPLLFVLKPSSTGLVTETIDAFNDGNAGFFQYSYTVSGLPSSDFTLNPSTLNRGHVIGAGGISDTATYTSKHSSTIGTTGRMSGSLAVTFASIGRATPFPISRAAQEWGPKANQ